MEFVDNVTASDWYTGRAVVVLLPEGERDEWHGYYTLAARGQDYVFTAPDSRRFRFPRDDAEAADAHYDRAIAALERSCCAVRVGQQPAAVIDGEGGQARWLSFANGAGGVWACQAYAPSDEAALAALDRIPDQGWERLIELDLPGGRYCIQEAGPHGREPGIQRIAIELRPGKYTVSRLDFAPDEETLFYLHRLELAR